MYKLIEAPLGITVIVRDNNDGTFTSFIENPDNTDYQAYLKWLSDGNQPLPAEGTE